jgi:hypothetical protein
MAIGPHFDPKTPLGMFYRAHDAVFGKLTLIAEIQNGPNPLTAAEWKRMQERWPERYGRIPYIAPRDPA